MDGKLVLMHKKTEILKPVKVNLLSKTTNMKYKCELCTRYGSLMCATCGQTYYCSHEHFKMDKNLHSQICHKIKAVRKPLEFSMGAEVRDRFHKQREILRQDLYNYTFNRGQAHMEAGNFDEAIPAATMAAKYAQIMYGNSVKMIPALLVSAECYIHSGKLNVADGYLSRALFIELETPDISPSIKAHVRRIEGLCHLARKNFVEAKECFAEEIYQNSIEFGPTHIRTSGGFCYLGHIFYKNRRYEEAVSLFRQTIDIWFQTVDPIIEEMTKESHLPIIKGIKKEEKKLIEESDLYMGLKLMEKCVEHLIILIGINVRLELARAFYTIGALHYIGENNKEGKKKGKAGLQHLATETERADLLYKKLIDLIKFCDRRIDLEKEKH